MNGITSYFIRNQLHTHLDERKSLFYEFDFTSYEVVMTGDSVFCCNYSTNPDKTIWAAIADFSGKKVFPGAIDGSKPLDLINTAEYLSDKLKPGAVVFLDSTPSRKWDDMTAENYHNRFFLLRGYTDKYLSVKEKLFNSYIVPVTRGWFRGRDLFEVGASMFGRSYYKSKVKNWRDSIEETRKNRRLHAKKERVTSDRNRLSLLKISEIYRKKGIRLVVVITPFNMEMARLMGDGTTKAMNNHENIVSFLKNNGIEYLDFFNGMESDMFVDMIHTNTEGDYLMAKKMADYLEVKK